MKKLIKNNADRFQIPGEPLEATNVLQHSIPTVLLWAKTKVNC